MSDDYNRSRPLEAEIERLRGEIERLKDEIKGHLVAWDIERADNERRLAALNTIEIMFPETTAYVRRVLEEKPGTIETSAYDAQFPTTKTYR